LTTAPVAAAKLELTEELAHLFVRRQRQVRHTLHGIRRRPRGAALRRNGDPFLIRRVIARLPVVVVAPVHEPLDPRRVALREQRHPKIGDPRAVGAVAGTAQQMGARRVHDAQLAVRRQNQHAENETVRLSDVFLVVRIHHRKREVAVRRERHRAFRAGHDVPDDGAAADEHGQQRHPSLGFSHRHSSYPCWPDHARRHGCGSRPTPVAVSHSIAIPSSTQRTKTPTATGNANIQVIHGCRRHEPLPRRLRALACCGLRASPGTRHRNASGTERPALTCCSWLTPFRAITAAALAALAGGCSPEPPPLATVSGFEVERYLGDWHQIAAIPAWFQDDCAADTMARYALAEDGLIAVVNTCATAGRPPSTGSRGRGR